MLGGLIRAGFSIHGTWPARSEMSTRNVGRGTNALASSIVLVCRPRPANASLATRKEFITALRRELPEALRNLQRGNIAPVDLAQAAIGPGMAVFTRYAKVIETDGSPMTVRTALGIINQALDEVLGRAGRGVRRRHPLGAGVVRAIRHGRRPIRRSPRPSARPRTPPSTASSKPASSTPAPARCGL